MPEVNFLRGIAVEVISLIVFQFGRDGLAKAERRRVASARGELPFGFARQAIARIAE